MKKTIEKVVLLSVCFLVLAACSKNASDDHLPASIQQIIDQDSSCICDPYIKKFSWRDQTVYLQGDAGPACNWFPIYYNSAGARIVMDSSYTYQDFTYDATFIKTVWSCQSTATH